MREELAAQAVGSVAPKRETVDVEAPDAEARAELADRDDRATPEP